MDIIIDILVFKNGGYAEMTKMDQNGHNVYNDLFNEEYSKSKGIFLALVMAPIRTGDPPHL